MEIFCNNEGAVALAQEPRSHKRSKHILRKYHYIREIVASGEVTISRVHTDANLADPFTKPLTQTKHDAHPKSIGLRFDMPMA